jgi:molecular chaperone GrpE
MTDEQKDERAQEETENEDTKQKPSAETSLESESIEDLKQSFSEANDKYVRLYADFENYKKIAVRTREDLLKYANEDLMVDILTVIDHLELALQHVSNNETSDSLTEGVNLTLKELKNVLEKHGLVEINTLGKPFDPAVHHAMSQIETEEAEENTVVKEFRKGYILRDRVLRAAMVGVAKKQAGSKKEEREVSTEENN